MSKVTIEPINVKYGKEHVTIMPSEKLLDIVEEYTVKQNIYFACKLVDVASMYNYYDACGSDIKAGNILVTNCNFHDDIIRVAKELLNIAEYEKLYNKTLADSQQMRIARGKAKFEVMLENNGR